MAKSYTGNKRSSAKTEHKIASQLREKRWEIWRLADADGWLSFLKAYDPKGQWSRKGPTLIGLCRLHNDHHPSLQVRVDKGMATCWACTPKKFHSSDPLELLQTFIKKSPVDIINLLQSHFGKKIFRPELSGKLELYANHRSMKTELRRMLNAIKLDSLLLYRTGGVKALKDSAFHFTIDFWEYMTLRKVVDAVIPLPMYPLPPRPVMTKYANDMGIPTTLLSAMEDYVQGVMKDAFIGNVLFMNDSGPNEISRMRLRRPVVDPNNKNISVLEDAFEDATGLFGLSMYMQLDSMDAPIGKPHPERSCYVVEGEFCVAQMVQSMLKDGVVDQTVVAHCGSASHDLSALQRCGYDKVYYIPDADEAGSSHAEAILSQNTNLDIRVFNWPVHLKSGGPEESADVDSSILRHGWPEVQKVLIKEREKHFLKSDLWASEKFASELRNYDTKDNAKAVKALAARLSRCLGDPADPTQNLAMRDWVTERLVQAGIKERVAEDMSADLCSEDNEERLLCRRIEEKLRERFCFICVEADSQGRILRSWDRRRSSMGGTRTNNEADIRAFFANSVGPLLDWVSRELGGEAAIIKYGIIPKDGDELPPERSILVREDHVFSLVKRFVMPKIVASLPTSTELTCYRAGNHHLETSTGYKYFVVNGAHVFMGSFDINNTLHWEELAEPRYEKYYFDIQAKEKFSQYIESVEDLRNPPKMSLEEALASVKDILNTGWMFKDQDCETTMLAGCMLYMPISSAFDLKLQLYASAERSSGKTTLVSRCIGGAGGAFYNLIEHAHAFDSFTAAGLRQRMDKNPRTLVLDEFDETDGDSNNKNSEIYKFLRIAFGGGMHAQGSQSGQAVEKSIAINIIFAGIDPKIGPANMSRTIRIDLISSEKKVSPEISLAEAYPKEHFEKMRRAITLNCYQWMPEIKKHYSEVKHYYGSQCRNEVPSYVNQRALDQILIPVSVCKAAGWDWKNFFQTLVKSKAQHFETVRDATEYQGLWSSVFLTSAVQLTGVESAGRSFSVQTLLSRPEDIHKLNQSECGIYYHKDVVGGTSREYLIALWTQVASSLFKNDQRYRGLSAHLLKDKANRHPNALNEVEARALAVRVGVVSPWLTMTQLSVFCLTDFAAGANTKKIQGATSHDQQASPPRDEVPPRAELSGEDRNLVDA